MRTNTKFSTRLFSRYVFTPSSHGLRWPMHGWRVLGPLAEHRFVYFITSEKAEAYTTILLHVAELQQLQQHHHDQDHHVEDRRVGGNVS